MSAVRASASPRNVPARSADRTIADPPAGVGGGSPCPNADLPAVLCDHLVGAGEQRWRDYDAKRLCGFQVYNQLEFVRLGDWQTGNLNAVKDLSNVHASFAIECREAWSVADQAPSRRECTHLVDRRNCIAFRQCHELLASTDEEYVGADDERVGM